MPLSDSKTLPTLLENSSIKKLSLISVSIGGLCIFSAQAAVTFCLVYLFTLVVCKLAARFEEQRNVILTLAIGAATMTFFGLRGYLSIEMSGSLVLAFVGFSFLIFRVIHVIFEVWRRQIRDLQALDLLLYLCFLPTYFAGPIELWRPFFDSLSKGFRADLAKQGIWRIALAIPIKLLLVDQLIVGKLLIKAATTLEANLNLGSILVFGLVNYLRAYFDLFAYSEIAIGACALIGFKTRENLDRPWAKTNIGDFWRSWHMSVTNWCTYHVFFPVFGKWRNMSVATASSMMVMAFWHGTTLNWIMWGLHHTIGLVIYGRVSKKLKALEKKRVAGFYGRISLILAWLLTQLYVTAGYFYVGNGIEHIFRGQ